MAFRSRSNSYDSVVDLGDYKHGVIPGNDCCGGCLGLFFDMPSNHSRSYTDQTYILARKRLAEQHHEMYLKVAAYGQRIDTCMMRDTAVTLSSGRKSSVSSVSSGLPGLTSEEEKEMYDLLSKMEKVESGLLMDETFKSILSGPPSFLGRVGSALGSLVGISAS